MNDNSRGRSLQVPAPATRRSLSTGLSMVFKGIFPSKKHRRSQSSSMTRNQVMRHQSTLTASRLPTTALTLAPASLSTEPVSNSPANVIDHPDTQPKATDQRASGVPNLSATASPAPDVPQLQDGPVSTLQPNEVQTLPKACLWEQIVLKLSAEEQELCKEKLAPLLDANRASTLTPANCNLQAPPTCIPSEGPTGVILNKLIAEAHRKRQECEDKRWKILIRGREIIFRSVIDKIVDFAKKFRDIGTIVTSYNPVYSALPWAAFVVLLQFTIADKELFGHIISGLESTARLLADGAFYEKLYLTEGANLPSSEKLHRFEESLTDIYCAILSYLLKIISIVEKMRSLGAQWDLEELVSSFNTITSMEVILRNQVEQVEIEVRKCTNERFTQNFACMLSHVIRCHSYLRNSYADQEALENELSKIHNRQFFHYDQKVDQMVEQLKDQERKDILAWLSIVAYPNNHASAEEGRVPGTGQWLLKHKTFVEWVGANGSSCIWLKGNAGAGKTTLASLVVQTLKDRLYTSTNSEALAYFYCNRGDQQRAQPEVVMSTLVQQLASLRPGEQLQKVVVDEYRLRVKATGRPSPLNLTHGNALAQALCNIYPQTWIIVDALDECDENTRQLLIHRFLDLVKGCTSLVKIFVTSRLDSDITATLDSDAIFVRSISLHGENESSEVRGDMRHIVEGRVQKAFDEGGVLPGKLDKDKAQELKSEIIEILLTRGDRMPLWVTYQIQNICVTNRRSYQTPKHILTALMEFPAGLTQTYGFMLQHLLKNPKVGANPLGIAALQWVMTAPRPLTPNQLLGAVARNDDNITLDNILEVCNNLLIYDEQQEVIRFYHISIREYLEKHWPETFDENVVRPALVEEPLSLLAQINRWDHRGFSTATINSGSFNPQHPRTDELLCYISNYWPAYIPKDSKCQALQSFLENSEAYTAWVAFLNTDYRGMVCREVINAETRWRLAHVMQTKSDINLFVAVRWGLVELTKVLIGSGLKRTRPKRVYDVCFETAAEYGHSEVVKALLENGVEPGTPPYIADCTCALKGAARGGHELLVKFLVEQGGELCNGAALTAATKKGHMAIVRFLVEQGADPNNGEALASAAELGDEAIAQFLVENGADPNNSKGLVGAAREGKVAIVRFLVEHGADPNNGEALADAAYQGNMAIVRYLVEKGADPNNCEALIGAASRGNEAIVRFLVENGADANNSKALVCGVGEGNEAIVQCLVEHGADPNNGKALVGAAREGNEAIIRYLVEQGADPNNSEALVVAAEQGLEAIVRYLVEQGADANNGEALAGAAEWGHETIVGYLVGQGADPNNSEALAGAAERGHEAIVRYLVEQGADPNNGKALAGAAEWGYETIVRYLVEQDTYPNNREALSGAAERGREAILRYLVEQGTDPNNGEALAGTTEQGREAIVQFLVEDGADLASQEALITAARWSNEAIVQFLVEKGANPTYREALITAAKWGHEAIVRFLVENGADPTYREALVSAASGGNEAIVRYPMEKGAGPNNGKVVWLEHGKDLVSAASRGNEAIVRFLVEKGADANNCEALIGAASGGNKAIVRFLVEHGADPSNEKALAAAAHRKDKTILKYLLDRIKATAGASTTVHHF